MPLLLLIPSLLTAQPLGWAGLAFEHEVTPTWGYFIETEYRRALDSPADGRFLLLLAGNKKFADRTNVAFGARLEPGNNGDPATVRVFTDLNYKYELGEGPFTLEARLRYQQDRPPGQDGSLRSVALRPRLGIATTLNDQWTLVTEYELRYRFDSRDEVSRHRYTGGLAYKVSDRVTLEGFFRVENRVNADQRTDHIIGLYLDYVLPDRRERDWKYRRPFGRRVIW